jgi:hypothetical protein
MDISPQRLSCMITAIELEVDDTDFRFESFAEREAWSELLAEHEVRVAKDDLVWLVA